MFRIAILSGLALASALVASAGQIQVGGANGLTTAYVGSGNCANACTDQYNYDEVLFNNSAGTTPTPYTGYNTFAASAGTITDSTTPATTANPGGITFNMINDGTYTQNCDGQTSVCYTSNNFWALEGNGAGQEITVPVDVYAVSQVWGLINSYAAGDLNSDRSTTEWFNFSATPNGAVVATVRVNFTNTNSTTGSPTGQMQNSIICTTITSCQSLTDPNDGPLQTTNPTNTTANGVTVGVDADQVYSYPNSAGNNTLVLDDQGVLLGTLNLGGGYTNYNTYLQSVQVKEESPSGFPSEYDALSALTVVSTPEPATVVMFLTGLGAIGLAGFRRRKA